MSGSGDRVRSNRKLFLQYLAKLRRDEIEKKKKHSDSITANAKKDSINANAEADVNMVAKEEEVGTRSQSEAQQEDDQVPRCRSEDNALSPKSGKKVGFILEGVPKSRSSYSRIQNSSLKRSLVPDCEQEDYGSASTEPSQVAVMRMLCIAAFECAFVIFVILALVDMLFKNYFVITLIVYGPGSLICLFASYSWRSRSAFFLRVLDMVLSCLEVVLLCYVSFALFREGDEWGYVALGVVVVLFPLKLAAAAGNRSYKTFRRKFQKAKDPKPRKDLSLRYPRAQLSMDDTSASTIMKTESLSRTKSSPVVVPEEKTSVAHANELSVDEKSNANDLSVDEKSTYLPQSDSLQSKSPEKTTVETCEKKLLEAEEGKSKSFSESQQRENTGVFT